MARAPLMDEMIGVMMGFIEHFERLGRKGCGELLRHACGHAACGLAHIKGS